MHLLFYSKVFYVLANCSKIQCNASEDNGYNLNALYTYERNTLREKKNYKCKESLPSGCDHIFSLSFKRYVIFEQFSQLHHLHFSFLYRREKKAQQQQSVSYFWPLCMLLQLSHLTKKLKQWMIMEWRRKMRLITELILKLTF